MRIIPFSNFDTSLDSAAADFPALELLWHYDDVTTYSDNTAVSWVDRVLGSTITINPGGS
jgi:hypothetical protein